MAEDMVGIWKVQDSMSSTKEGRTHSSQEAGALIKGTNNLRVRFIGALWSGLLRNMCRLSHDAIPSPFLSV